MLKNQDLGDGFTLQIGLAEIHVPRMWVERMPADSESQVRAMRENKYASSA